MLHHRMPASGSEEEDCSVVRQCPRQPSPTAKQAPGPFDDFVGEGGKRWGSATFAEPDLELSFFPIVK